MDKPKGATPTTEHSFAPFIRILGKGKTSTRSLSQGEAEHAFGMILRGDAEPLQIGAFLMLLRVKEESPDELAGFVQACRTYMKPPPFEVRADLDWSSYAGKKHQHPWFILSLLLLAQAGHRVFIHGSAGHTPDRLYTEKAMRQLGLPVASHWAEVSQQLNASNLSYLSLAYFCSPLEELMQLRPLMGLRSPVNTLSRMLMQPCSLVFKGDSGEVEVKPQADTRLYRLHDQQTQEILLPRSLAKRVEPVATPDVESIKALWRGRVDDRYGLNATLATAAVALLVLCPDITLEAAQIQASELWQNRDTARLS